MPSVRDAAAADAAREGGFTFPADAALAMPCASGPTVLYVDSTGDAGGPWPVTVSDNQALWSGPVASGAYLALHVLPVGWSGEPWVLVLDGVPDTALAPGHYFLPPPASGGLQMLFQVAGAICEMPPGSLDVYAFEDTGGDQATLTTLLATFDVACGGANYVGCINYSATPSTPPPVPAADPADPMTACGGSARDVVRVNDMYVTNMDALVSVSTPSPNDILVTGGALSLEFTGPQNAILDVATYGPGAHPRAPLPNVTVTVNGDVQCEGLAAGFTLYDWQSGSLVLGYDCVGTTHWKGCVRYAK
jgi:hypothetical protein